MTTALLQEIQENDHVVDLSESLRQIFDADLIANPHFITKGVNALLKKPYLASAAALLAMTSYSKYLQNKKFTTQLFARSQEEKKLYTGIVADLVKSGGYSLVNTKYLSGGTLYTVRKSKS